MAEGARVVITGRDRDLGERAAAGLGAQAPGSSPPTPADPEAVAASVSAAVGPPRRA